VSTLLAQLRDEVQALLFQRETDRLTIERLEKRVRGLAVDESALVRQRIALEAIKAKCDEALGPRGKSAVVERIRSLAQAGLDAGNEVQR